MKKLFYTLFASLILAGILPAISMAQPYIDLLNVKAQGFLPQSNTSGDNNTKMFEKQFEGAALMPIIRKNNDIIMIGADVYHLDFQTTGEQTMNSSVTSASLDLGYQKMWNKHWQTLLMAIPKLNGQQLQFSSNDFQMGGILLFTYTKNNNLKYDIGAYYNKEFFGGYYIPLVGINWNVNDHVTVFGDLPANFNFEYKVNKHVFTGVSFLSIVSSYKMNETPGNMYVRDGNKLFGHDEIKAYINYYITKVIVWYAEVGQTMGRDYQLYDSSNQDVENTMFQPYHNGMFVNTGMAIRFRLDGK